MTFLASQSQEASSSSSSLAVSSTSTLLQEISTLRQRLQELEHDTDGRSSVISVDQESPLVVMLRKDVAQLELEKAQLERDLINQMNQQQEEHALQLEELRRQLEQAASEKVTLQEKLVQQTDENRYVRLMQEERKQHQKIVDQMKENLATADLEITESRREMDHLHERLDESEVEKEELLAEITKLRLECERAALAKETMQTQLESTRTRETDLQHKLESQTKTVNENETIVKKMNKDINTLKEHNQALLSDNQDVRCRLEKAQEQLEQEKLRSDTMSTQASQDEYYEEKNKQLENSVRLLEAKLDECSLKLSEKEKKIELLSASITEEHRLNNELRAEIKRINGNSPDIKASEKRIAAEVDDNMKELNFLRNQNKVLNDEIKNLRRIQQLQNQRGASPLTRTLATPDTAASRENSRSKSASPFRPRASPLTPAPPSVPRRTLGKDPKSPRFTGIVASFERRIAEQGTPRRSSLEHPPSIAPAPSEDEENDYYAVELQREKDKVQQLQQQLELETRRVQELNSLLEQSSTAGDLERQLYESQEQVSRLRSELEQCQMEKSELESALDQVKQESRKTTASLEKRIEVLRGVVQKQDGRNDDELERLRTQVGALKPELDHAMEEIEHLEGTVAALQQKLKQAESGGPRQQELDDLLRAKKLGEQKLAQQIADLENELEVIEMAAEEELEVKQAEIDKLKAALSSKEKEISRLEEERTHLCSSMNDVSLSRKDEMDELQAELVEITAKTKAQAREIGAYKLEVSELRMKLKEGQGSDALKTRIKELEQENKGLNMRNQDDVDAIKSENRKLRDAMREIKVERRALQDRLDSLLTDKTNSKSSQVLRERNTALKSEVEKLTRRLKKMEDSITRFAI